jgi:hypothetical protein
VSDEQSRRAWDERNRRLAAERLAFAERFEALTGSGPVPESPGAEEYVASLEQAVRDKDAELVALRGRLERESLPPRLWTLRRALRFVPRRRRR